MIFRKEGGMVFWTSLTILRTIELLCRREKYCARPLYTITAIRFKIKLRFLNLSCINMDFVSDHMWEIKTREVALTAIP